MIAIQNVGADLLYVSMALQAVQNLNPSNARFVHLLP